MRFSFCFARSHPNPCRVDKAQTYLELYHPIIHARNPKPVCWDHHCQETNE